jgi:hypothetical protein
LQAANKIHIAMGLVGVAVGAIPLLALLGILPTRPPAPGDAPNWIGGAIGLAFFLGGVAVIVRSFVGADDSSGDLPATAPRALRGVYDLIGTAIPVLLSVLFSWVAFGPGERHFGVSGGSGSTAMAMGVSGGHAIIGRIAFGFGAVLGWIIAGWTILVMARRRFPRR